MPTNLHKVIDRMVNEGWSIHEIRSRLLKLGYKESLVIEALTLKSEIEHLKPVEKKKIKNKSIIVICLIVAACLITSIFFPNKEETLKYLLVVFISVLGQAFIMQGSLSLYMDKHRKEKNTYSKALIILLLVNLPSNYFLTLVSDILVVFIPAYVLTGFFALAIMVMAYDVDFQEAGVCSTATMLGALLITLIVQMIVNKGFQLMMAYL